MSFKEKYIQYCASNKVQLFFQPYWLDVYGHPWEVLFAEIESHQAFFVFHNEKKLGLRFVRNAHLTPYTGLVFCSDISSEEIKTKLVNLLIDMLPKFNILELDLSLAINVNIPFNKFDVSLKRTNILFLHNENSIYKDFKPSLKRQIQKANKSLFVYEADNIELFLTLHQKTFAKQNKQPSVPEIAYRNYWNCCKKHSCGRLFFIEDSDKNAHAALWLVHDESTSYYLAGGTDDTFYGSGAMSKLMWYAIQFSIQQKKTIFDFEGSMHPSIDRFFKNYSPKEVNYIHLEKINSTLYKLLKKQKGHH